MKIMVNMPTAQYSAIGNKFLIQYSNFDCDEEDSVAYFCMIYYLFSYCETCKGQKIISKANYQVLISSKKRSKYLPNSALAYIGQN